MRAFSAGICDKYTNLTSGLISTSAKRVVVIGAPDSYTNLKQLVLQERFLDGSRVLYLTDGNEWFFQVYMELCYMTGENSVS